MEAVVNFRSIVAQDPDTRAAIADRAGLHITLDKTSKGTPLSNLSNAVRVLEQYPAYKDNIWFDEFLQRIMTADPIREWKDADDIQLTLFMQQEVGLLRMSRDVVSQAVIGFAFQHVR